MKIEEIRSKNETELRSILSDHKKESLNLRFQKTYGQLNNTSRVSFVKKMIARILTVLNEQSKKTGDIKNA